MLFDENTRMEFALTGLVNRLFVALDNQLYDDVARLFADDGVWHRQGTLLTGPAMVHAALMSRPIDFTTRHLVTNVIATAASEVEAQVTMYVTVYAHHGPGEVQLLPMVAPTQISVYTAHCVKADRWQIRHLSGKPTFRTIA